ncbi:MAG TPA: LysE family transporter [Firmicutes bacterium]|nr:LysE family transporter [Bacillota bacterium]
MLRVFLQSLFVGYSGAVMPGSLLTYTIDQALRYGPQAGLAISLGHALLEFFLVIGIFFGLGNYLSSSSVQALIGILGGIILVFLGLKMIKDSLAKNLAIDFGGGAAGRGGQLVSGVLLSASNPYFLVWWAVVGLGMIMSAYNSFGLLGIALFYFGHILADITWYSFVSTLISRTKAFISLRFYRNLVLALGAFLIITGLGFLLNSLRIVF